MKKQEDSSIHTPEDLLSAAEALAAPYLPAGGGICLPRWAQNILWALGGAGAASLLWIYL